MKGRMIRLSLSTVLILGAVPVLGAGPTPAPAAAEQGDLWEITSQMSMEGIDMAMPAQKLQACSPKQWKRPPAPMDERQKCTTSDFKVEGPKATWKVTCSGEMAMTGVGEITRSGADDYTGTIKFTGDGGNLTMKLVGHRTGPCDSPQY